MSEIKKKEKKKKKTNTSNRPLFISCIYKHLMTMAHVTKTVP